MVNWNNLNDIADYARSINKTNGFGEEPPPNHFKLVQLMLIATEISEAARAYQNNKSDDEFVEELADAVIRILDMAAFWHFDIDRAVRDKLEKNKRRGYKHGNKKV